MKDPEDWYSKIWILEIVCQLKTMHSVSCELLFGAKWGLQLGSEHHSSLWEAAPERHWGRSKYEILLKGELEAIKRLLYKNFSASHEELMSPQRDSVRFNIWGDARIGITKSVPENICPSGDVFHQFPWSTECLRLRPEFPVGVSQVSSCSTTGSQLRRGRRQRPLWSSLFSCWQVLLARANLPWRVRPSMDRWQSPKLSDKTLAQICPGGSQPRCWDQGKASTEPGSSTGTSVNRGPRFLPLFKC